MTLFRTNEEAIGKLLGDEEKELKSKIPSFVDQPDSPTKLFSDYQATGNEVFKNKAGQALTALRNQSISAAPPSEFEQSILGKGISKLPSKVSKPLLKGGEAIRSFMSPPSFSSFMKEALEEDSSRSIDELTRRAQQLEKEQGILTTSGGNRMQIDPTGFMGTTKKVTEKPAKSVFEGFKDISSTVLEKLRGKSVVSKQFIEDTLKQADVRKPDAEMIRAELAAMPDNKVDVSEFANRVKENQILPLEPKIQSGTGSQVGYYDTALPDDLRGPIADYSEHIYQSPISTSAGNVHFGGDAPNYFAHTRVEDLAAYPGLAGMPPQGDSGVRRVIEIQSDLFQKGRLEGEASISRKARILQEQGEEGLKEELKSLGFSGSELSDTIKKAHDELSHTTKRIGEVAKLEPYRNTWHERIIREEVKQAAKDGKVKLQFPTGETAMKIEGLGERNTFWLEDRYAEGMQLKADELEVGQRIIRSGNQDDWIITDVLGDGKFKAVPKERRPELGFTPHHYEEEFDISGTVDKQNPIYKFYEKDVRKFLTNKFNAKEITDDKGVKWLEVDVKPFKDQPILAHGKAQVGSILGGAAATTGIAGGAIGADKLFNEPVEYKKQTSERLLAPESIPFDREAFRARILHNENRGAIAAGANLYEQEGVTGDIGKYQVKPQTLKDWSGPWLGEQMTPEEFKNNPEAQEEFFNQFLAVVERLNLTPEEAAVTWHRGWGELGTGPKDTRDKRFKKRLDKMMTEPESVAYLKTFSDV